VSGRALFRSMAPVAITAVLLMAVPALLGGSSYMLRIASLTVIVAIYAVAFNLLFGHTRQLFLCIGALAGLVLFSPLFLILSALIKVVSPGPAFFKQERVGHMGDTFTLWKFRTMHLENDAAAHRRYLGELIRGEKPMEKLDAARDPRIIPFGKLLRRTCLDELPQLLNTLRGDMSLVGPRPERPFFVERHKALQGVRLAVKPGLTGLAQVRSYYDLKPAHKVKYDYLYIQNRSLLLNISILLQTIPVLFAKKGW
jgi:lipopolysaccharide/colanic/teichoic acid biosynthesis glycosyltransferase